MNGLLNSLTAGELLLAPPVNTGNAADSGAVDHDNLVVLTELDCRLNDVFRITALETAGGDQTLCFCSVTDLSCQIQIQRKRLLYVEMDAAFDQLKFDFAVAVRGNTEEDHIGLGFVQHLLPIGVSFAASGLLLEIFCTFGNQVTPADQIHDVLELYKMAQVILSDTAAADESKSLFHDDNPPNFNLYESSK